MRIANHAGRLVLVTDDGVVDVEESSAGRFSSDPQAVYEHWDDFRDWAATLTPRAAAPLDIDKLGPPVPRPRQVFAIGLNYVDHAEEVGIPLPAEPVVFTKYVSSFTGALAEVVLPADGTTDWEVELVAVIGRRAERVSADDAWDHVAGLTVGQDLSERLMQNSGPAPQFSLAKSFAGFTPMGPWLVTPDEVDTPDDLALTCAIDGVTVQSGRTSNMVFSIPELIARISRVITLYPGDIIFTGTPAGVGVSHHPPRFLRAGERLTSSIEGIGEITQRFVSPAEPALARS